jgi:transcriptional regulator with XRE-family HTH domain
MGKHIGNYIKELRERRGLSQADVARSLGLRTAQSISNIERGVSPLPRAKIRRFADILGVRKGDIVEAVMREMQERVSKAAGVQSRSLLLGPEISSEDLTLVASVVDRLREAKAGERTEIKRALRRIVGRA